MLSFAGSSRGVSVDLSTDSWSYTDAQYITVMPLGDSITSGVDWTPAGAYRAPLWNLLTSDGRAVDFVGQYRDASGSLPDRDHEGTSGQTADQLRDAVPGLMSAYRPDIVLLMIGSNDIEEQGQDPASLRDEISQILDEITATLPNTTVFISTLTPLSSEHNGYDKIDAANDMIRALAATKGDHVKLVDLGSAIGLGDLADGVHLNASGNAKLAQAWFDAMRSHVPIRADHPTGFDPNENAVSGSLGSDQLVGNDQANWFFGDGGDDALFGMGGADALYGGDGDDRIVGGFGRDIMVGGAGNDTFVFTSRFETGKTSSQRDFIADFQYGDKIDLSAIDASTRSSGDQAFHRVSHFTGGTRQLEWHKSSGSYIVSGDVNGDARADFSIKVKMQSGSLHSWDFIM